MTARFGSGFRILDPSDPAAYTTCFTAGYGKSLMCAGSYLCCSAGVRRFAPAEVARLLGFPSWFRFPELLPVRKRWHLLGNSLSVAAVREVLRDLPGSGLPDDVCRYDGGWLRSALGEFSGTISGESGKGEGHDG